MQLVCFKRRFRNIVGKYLIKIPVRLFLKGTHLHFRFTVIMSFFKDFFVRKSKHIAKV